MISDNGKNFKDKKVKRFASSKNVKWVHIVERSPWWGGFYEGVVRSVKRCLKKVLGTARLTYEELLTLLVQAEGVLNSRPLTYLYDNGSDPLTPSHLVLGRRLLSQRQDEAEENPHSGNSTTAKKREKHLKTVLQHFRKRWQSEYLTQLREHHSRPEKRGPPINIGDIVTIQEDKTSRLNWTIGRVEQLLSGNDGKVRAALLRTTNKSGQPIAMKRPLQKLFPIELRSDRERRGDFPITFVEYAKREN